MVIFHTGGLVVGNDYVTKCEPKFQISAQHLTFLPAVLFDNDTTVSGIIEHTMTSGILISEIPISKFKMAMVSISNFTNAMNHIVLASVDWQNPLFRACGVNRVKSVREKLS